MRHTIRTLLLLVICHGVVTGQTLPQFFSRVQVGGQINNPSAMAFAPDGRIFVAQQTGNLRVVKDGTLLTTPFVSITVDAAGERGLLGIAFDPDFATNNYVYLYYTVPAVVTPVAAPPHNRISRFTANGDVAVVGSEQIILELDNLSSATNHNGGALSFGPDGKLYVAIGENASGANAPNLDTYHGKFLRINKDGSAPSDNPFTTGSEQRRRVWSYGLRNPFTFSIQPGTGRIFLNDVGQSAVEEVNNATLGGRNFGWPATEGTTANPAYTSPVYQYLHTGAEPTGCAITGGTFFNPPAGNYPSQYTGKYFILDLCSAWIYWFNPDESSPVATLFASNIGGQSLALTVGPDGNLYYLSRSSQRLYRIIYTPSTPPAAPSITAHPLGQSTFVGQTVTLGVTATGAQPLGYQWRRDGQNIAGATQATLVIQNVQVANAGNYTVVVSNTVGSVESNQAALQVSPAPTAPGIATPPASLSREVGQSASFTVTATGSSPLNYQWQKNSVNINNATQSSYTINNLTMLDAGRFRVTVSNAGGLVTSSEALLTVTSNSAPVANILTPGENTLYRAGQVIQFSGSGTDPEDGAVPVSAMSWGINFHHDTHKHDQPPIDGIAAGSFAIPNRGETASNVWYRIILTVTDSKGLQGIDSVDVLPRKSSLVFATDPAGLSLTLDGQPMALPATINSVVGLERDLVAQETQTLSGVEYQFVSWSTGGTATQTIITPESNTTYTAAYAPVLGVNTAGAEHNAYPNPANEWLFTSLLLSDAVAINAIGQRFGLLFHREGTQSRIDVSQLPPALYTFVLMGADSSSKVRILIAR